LVSCNNEKLLSKDLSIGHCKDFLLGGPTRLRGLKNLI
jgi:hypothetical protein